jgi:hypothetical protein
VWCACLLLNAWRSISCTLEGERKDAVGADEVLPVFVWVLLHSGCRTFVHDLNWIRFGTGVSGEAGAESDYWLTMAECALNFIERMHQGMIREKEPGEWERLSVTCMNAGKLVTTAREKS